MEPAETRHGERSDVVIEGIAFGQPASGLRKLLSPRKRDARIGADDLRVLFDAIPTPLVLAGEDGRVLLANTAAATLFGYAHDAMPRVFADTLLPAWQGGAQELVATRADDSEFPVDVTTTPLRFAGMRAMLIAVSDATQRHRQAREAAQLRDELAHLSRVAMLGELSGALAHELNQPLSAILSNAQAAQRLMRLDPPDLTEVRDIIDDIVVDDRHAGEVIQRLRKWLRKEHIEHVPLSLNGVVLDALHLMRGDLLSRGIDVQLELAGELPRLAGDRIQLQQVVLNLVLNGCDAMQGMPTPHVLRIRTHAAKDVVRLEVLDRGTGIDPSIAQSMFEPFVSTKADGMGMGLAVCRTIIASHGGHLWAASLDDVGARVAFDLPVLPS